MATPNRALVLWACGLALTLVSMPLDAGVAHAKKGKRWAAGAPGDQVVFAGASQAQGRVQHLLVNPFGEVDGLLLESGVLVTYPKHMGRQLSATVKRGDSVEVHGSLETAGQIKGYQVTNLRTGQSVVTQPKPGKGIGMPGVLRRMGLERMQAQGEIQYLRHGKRGEVNGLILADGTIVRLPKHAAQQFASLLQVGQSVSASGFGTKGPDGRALEATALGPAGGALQPIYRR